MAKSDDSFSGFHKYGDHGSFEVYWQDKEMQGWYWWPRFPGKDPDDDPEGPFDTSEEAYRDAFR